MDVGDGVTLESVVWLQESALRSVVKRNAGHATSDSEELREGIAAHSSNTALRNQSQLSAHSLKSALCM